jgi:hypothetical protein
MNMIENVYIEYEQFVGFVQHEAKKEEATQYNTNITETTARLDWIGLDWIEVQNNNQSTNIESISKNQFKK